MSDITSANAILVFAVPDYLPVPQQIQGFSTDDIFSTDSVTPIETMMGVDGQLSAGYLFVEKKMTVTLMASSPSNFFFDQLQAGEDAAVQAFAITGVITLPSLQMSYNLINGYMTGYPPIADAKKVMQPRKYTITWQAIQPSPISVAG